jgi:hypothetical protein
MPDSAASDSTPSRPRPAGLPEIIPGSLGPWSGHAICIGEDPDLFFPSYGDPGTRRGWSAPTARSAQTAWGTRSTPTSSASGAASTKSSAARSAVPLRTRNRCRPAKQHALIIASTHDDGATG